MATAIFEGGLRHKILISTYGGFFRDSTTGEYYEFKDEDRQEWDKFREENFSLLNKQIKNTCIKCNIEKLKQVSEQLDSLKFNVVFDFL
ncbi:MAG TPA: hypothetical protein VFG10_12265 [Saprospiraceae bacterium]|nr:hypothetical protein [Saprospiraceae bacterium]